MLYKEKKLPSRLSGMIRIALADLEKVEKDERYKVDMDIYHDKCYVDTNPSSSDKRREEVCSVCFAGAVMAKTCEGNISEEIIPADFDDENTVYMLEALDDVRQYDIPDIYVGVEPSEDIYEHIIMSIPFEDRTPYNTDPVQFKKNMHYIADRLEKNGL